MQWVRGPPGAFTGGWVMIATIETKVILCDTPECDARLMGEPDAGKRQIEFHGKVCGWLQLGKEWFCPACVAAEKAQVPA